MQSAADAHEQMRLSGAAFPDEQDRLGSFD